MPHNAAGSGAVGTERHAVGHRNCGTGGRAAGDARGRAVKGIERRAVVRIDPEAGEGELGHVAAPDRNEARRPQARHGRCILRRGALIPQRDRAGGGHVAGNVEQILDRDRNAGERRGATGGAQAVIEVGGRKRVLGVDLEEGPAAFAGRLGNPCQTLLDQRTACAAPGELRSKLRQGLHCPRWRTGS
jgi:hypothetical protein